MDNVKYNLTDRQKQIFDYMVLYYKANGVTPTQREVAEELDISQASIAKHLAAIERRGWIKRSNGMKNALVILD